MLVCHAVPRSAAGRTATRRSRGRRDGRRRWPGPTATLPPCPSRRAAGSGWPCRGVRESAPRPGLAWWRTRAPGAAGRGARARRRGPCSRAERLLLAHGLRADRSGVQPDVGLPVSRRRGALGTAHARAGRPEPPARARARGRPDVAGQPRPVRRSCRWACSSAQAPSRNTSQRCAKPGSCTVGAVVIRSATHVPHSATRWSDPAPEVAAWQAAGRRHRRTARCGLVQRERWGRARSRRRRSASTRPSIRAEVGGSCRSCPAPRCVTARSPQRPGRHDGPFGAALVAGTGPGPGARPPDVSRRGAHGGGDRRCNEDQPCTARGCPDRVGCGPR